jgi:uncharacterized alkaline shock family protein YloU
MASTYTTRLRFEKQGDGENPNSWGDILNQNVIDLIDEAVAGYVVVSVSGSPISLSENNGAVDQSRNASLEFAGTLTADVTITIPSHEKTYFLRNVATGSFAVKMKTASGSVYSVPSSQNVFVACNGTDIYQVDFPTSVSSFTANQLTVVSAVSGTNATFANGSFTTNVVTPRVSAATSLAIATSGVDRINIDANGNVGFGTSIPVKQLEITKSARAHVVSLTDVSTSIAINFNTAQNFAIQLVGNRTFENPSNCAAGQTGSIFIQQNVSGGKTLSFGSNWKFPNGEAPTLTTTASAVDRLDYIVYTSTAIHTVMTLDVR